MPRINLLPWREQERKVRRREFMVGAGGAVFAAAIFVLGGKLLYTSWIDSQNEKNSLLKKEIVKLDAAIADIQDLENRKQRLVARMEIIEKLQRKRPEIVHLFDEIVKTVPDGVYLTGIKQTGNRLEIRGIAQSSTRVSSFMRNIDSSVWTSKTAAKQRSRRLRRNEVFRSTPFSRSARRRPLAAAGARLLHRGDICHRGGFRLVPVRLE